MFLGASRAQFLDIQDEDNLAVRTGVVTPATPRGRKSSSDLITASSRPGKTVDGPGRRCARRSVCMRTPRIPGDLFLGQPSSRW